MPHLASSETAILENLGTENQISALLNLGTCTAAVKYWVTQACYSIQLLRVCDLQGVLASCVSVSAPHSFLSQSYAWCSSEIWKGLFITGCKSTNASLVHWGGEVELIVACRQLNKANMKLELTRYVSLHTPHLASIRYEVVWLTQLLASDQLISAGPTASNRVKWWWQAVQTPLTKQASSLY